MITASLVIVFLLGLFSGAYLANKPFRERVNKGVRKFVRGLENLASSDEAKSRAKSKRRTSKGGK